MIKLFLRQASAAGALFVIFAAAAEWLLPGSVLPFLNLYWFAVAVFILILLSF